MFGPVLYNMTLPLCIKPASQRNGSQFGVEEPEWLAQSPELTPVQSPVLEP